MVGAGMWLHPTIDHEVVCENMSPKFFSKCSHATSTERDIPLYKKRRKVTSKSLVWVWPPELWRVY